MLEHMPVKSSNIESVGYQPGNEDRGVLEVRFKNGRTYRYEGVPQAEHDALVTSESVGRAFAQRIRGQYRTERAE